MNTDLLIKLGVALAIVAVAYIVYAKFIRKDKYEDEAEQPMLDEDAEEDGYSVDDDDEDNEEIVEAEPFDEDAETAEDVVAEGMMGDEEEEEEEEEEEDEDEDDEVVQEEEGFTLAEGVPMAQDDTPVFTPPGM